MVIVFDSLSPTSAGASPSYKYGQAAGSQAAKDRFNNLFGSIENSCAAKADYYNWSNYNEFLQGCVDEYKAETGN